MSAYSYGIETDVRKSLGFISGAENFSVILNAALIKSKVQFAEGDLNRDRSLAGTITIYGKCRIILL